MASASSVSMAQSQRASRLSPLSVAMLWLMWHGSRLRRCGRRYSYSAGGPDTGRLCQHGRFGLVPPARGADSKAVEGLPPEVLEVIAVAGRDRASALSRAARSVSSQEWTPEAEGAALASLPAARGHTECATRCPHLRASEQRSYSLVWH